MPSARAENWNAKRRGGPLQRFARLRLILQLNLLNSGSFLKNTASFFRLHSRIDRTDTISSRRIAIFGCIFGMKAGLDRLSPDAPLPTASFGEG